MVRNSPRVRFPRLPAPKRTTRLLCSLSKFSNAACLRSITNGMGSFSISFNGRDIRHLLEGWGVSPSCISTSGRGLHNHVGQKLFTAQRLEHVLQRLRRQTTHPAFGSFCRRGARTSSGITRTSTMTGPGMANMRRTSSLRFDWSSMTTAGMSYDAAIFERLGMVRPVAASAPICASPK